MSTLPPHTDRAYALSRVDYGESDRIMTFLGSRLGKISVRARGARKSQKRFGGALELFSLVEISVERGRFGRLELVEARLIEDHLAIGTDLARFHCACFVLSLAKTLAVDEETTTYLFNLLDETLRALCRASGSSCTAVELGFAVQALEGLGTGIIADRCAVCTRRLPPQKRAFFEPGRGGVVCRACGGGSMVLSASALEKLGQLGRATFEDLASLCLDEDTLASIERAVRGFIEYHVGHRVSRAVEPGRAQSTMTRPP